MSVVDVDEILEHQLNANMLSMPYDVYSELFDAVDGLGVEIENLQSENAKLRVERDEWRRVAVSKQDIIDHMRDANAENAKLRERIHELEMEGSDHFYRTAYAEDANRTLEDENAKLREACAELLRMAERHDPEWLHWPEMHEELRKLGVKIVKL